MQLAHENRKDFTDTASTWEPQLAAEYLYDLASIMTFVYSSFCSLKL